MKPRINTSVYLQIGSMPQKFDEDRNAITNCMGDLVREAIVIAPIMCIF